jgi:hypothetical protein
MGRYTTNQLTIPRAPMFWQTHWMNHDGSHFLAAATKVVVQPINYAQDAGRQTLETWGKIENQRPRS